METFPALQHFIHSPLITTIWPDTLNKSMEPFFVVRESRYLSDTIGSNKLQELDLYLRDSRLRIPVLEVLGSDSFRVSIAERLARGSETPPLEIMHDLIAGHWRSGIFPGQFACWRNSMIAVLLFLTTRSCLHIFTV